MTIIDNTGKTFYVTDLPASIRQVRQFRTFRFDEMENTGLEKELRAYWEDIFWKLQSLQSPDKDFYFFTVTNTQGPNQGQTTTICRLLTDIPQALQLATRARTLWKADVQLTLVIGLISPCI